MSKLISHAEKKSAAAEKLPNFQGFSLLGVKKEVETLLSHIGKIRELFSTYTVHDISHIDAVLKSLDWLIPANTQKRMTSVDWLLITLSIYFHDLGMVVTAREYEERKTNNGFKNFRHQFENEEAGADYRDRVNELDKEDLEKFLYQEFIRTEHAARVREWIEGKSSYHWGDTVKPIVDALADVLQKLPTRFRTQLGIVCESHHKNDLDKLDKYPLCLRFGNDPQEVANIQYAALILRTADLLHVTADRTPSISYKILNLTDPLGVKEWEKQQGVISVGLRSRKYVEDDPETHEIQIVADFSEERPFFALTEYIS